MKKIVALTLALLMLIGTFAGCSEPPAAPLVGSGGKQFVARKRRASQKHRLSNGTSHADGVQKRRRYAA